LQLSTECQAPSVIGLLPSEAALPLRSANRLSQFVQLPENRSAFAAIAELGHGLQLNADCLTPIFVHGPAGCGKSRLLSALAEELTALSVCTLSANAFPLLWQEDTQAAERLAEARDCDLLIIEDLQHLPARAVVSFGQLFDERLRRRLPMVFTACDGPAQLRQRAEMLPARLATRLASGLVVSMAPLQTQSRRVLLRAFADRCGMSLPDELLDWMAQALTGSRQLEGALHQIRALEALQRRRLKMSEVKAHFEVALDGSRPTVERIVGRVSDYFRVEHRQLLSARRDRALLMARHVSMYLARQLTRLSLQQIGACFGGRDHTTVLHACRKVEKVMKTDAKLAGVVRQLQAELT
jgi:chromosomal replication initiator protein